MAFIFTNQNPRKYKNVLANDSGNFNHKTHHVHISSLKFQLRVLIIEGKTVKKKTPINKKTAHSCFRLR